jgi:hypothetical protein
MELALIRSYNVKTGKALNLKIVAATPAASSSRMPPSRQPLNW